MPAFRTHYNMNNFAIKVILLQVENSYLKLVPFHSRIVYKVDLKINYKIYDKEMPAIIFIFKDWHSYLEGISFPITLYSNHKDLEYFTTTKVLNCYYVR
jgi:hypothetical protein